MPTTQNRLSLARPLSEHDQRSAATLKAIQFSESITAGGAYPDNVDEAKVDATGGAVTLTLPAGSKEIIGLPYVAVKTDSSVYAVRLGCAGSDTFAGGASFISTTTQNARVGAYWDGTNWRDLFAGAANAATLSSSLVIGDGSGSPTLTMNKTAAGSLTWVVQAAGVKRGELGLDASENWIWSRHNSSGVLQDSIIYSNSTGMFTLPAGLTVTAGGATITAGGLTVTAGNTKIATPTHADEAAAVTAGLAAGTVYKTATGELRIKL